MVGGLGGGGGMGELGIDTMLEWLDDRYLFRTRSIPVPWESAMGLSACLQTVKPGLRWATQHAWDGMRR